MIDPEYLGDGVYATQEFDGVLLTTGTHEWEQSDQKIHLEAHVLVKLRDFVTRVAADHHQTHTDPFIPH